MQLLDLDLLKKIKLPEEQITWIEDDELLKKNLDIILKKLRSIYANNPKETLLATEMLFERIKTLNDSRSTARALDIISDAYSFQGDYTKSNSFERRITQNI